MYPRQSPVVTALAAFALFAFCARAQSGDPLGSKLFPPDLIMNNADAIGLTQEQREAVRDLVQEAQPHFGEMQEQLRQEGDALAKLLDKPDADQAAVLAQADKLMDRERDVKHAQLTLLLSLRKKLTDDQRAKLAQLRPEKPGGGGFPPQELRDKMERVKAAAMKWQSEGRDVAPIVEIMQQVDPLVRTGKMREAEALLDQALKLLEVGGK